jgi:putative ABC transport system permease protein
MRLVLAEAVLLGLVACALGLAAGLMMSLNAHRMAAETVGYAPPINVPWGIVVIGTGVVMAIALLASIIPAIHVSRTEPLALLQAGRASV